MLNTMKGKNISARIEVSEYSNKVLAVVKAKYGLKDKSEAINKFVELYGDEIVEKQASDKYIKEMLNGVKEHFKKYGYKSMSLKELDTLCEV
ncbi:MAG: antitoxin [Nanoarchaeota archaeon]